MPTEMVLLYAPGGRAARARGAAAAVAAAERAPARARTARRDRPLHPVASATTVRVRDGETEPTTGRSR
jgi:hypothetical protein